MQRPTHFAFQQGPIEGSARLLNQNGITWRFEGVVSGLGPGVGYYVEAARPMERKTSYAGSGLPYANVAMAMEKTPNHFTLSTNTFMFNIEEPNSFYQGFNNERIGPAIFFHLSNGVHKIAFPQLHPPPFLRSLSNQIADNQLRAEHLNHVRQDFPIQSSEAVQNMRQNMD